jgi:hypothetical protein
MKKICLVVVGLYIHLFAAFSQTTDSANYKSRKLKIEEVNFVSSYYHQDGDNSAVLGGIGTEKLSDYANNFEVKLNNYDKRKRKREWDLNIGIDYYTSASSDSIDPHTVSSPSHEDVRFYPSIAHVITNEDKGITAAFTGYFSIESDYESYGLSGSISKTSKDKSREFTTKAQA